MKPIQQKSRFRTIPCLAWIIIIPPLAVLLFMAMGAVLVVADPLKKADAIVILSGGSEQRMHEAISLYKEEYAQTIILTETGAVLEGYNTQYSFEQRLALLNADIPSSAIWITPRHAASTRDEAKDVRTLVENKGVHNLIVVTDPYHTLRTRMIWKEVFQNSEISIIVRPARGSWYKSSTWWLSAAGWENTVNEYVKLASYLIMRKGD
jgi:uncharacterized SAM-binding protein YcdF (DUF218 family)